MACSSNQEISEQQKPYFREICIGMEGIRAVLAICKNEQSPEAAFVMLKAAVVELHNIFKLTSEAGLGSKTITKFYGKFALVSLRNSICHIEQRVKFENQPPKSVAKKLSWETASIADGLAKSSNGGKSWQVSSDAKVFNFQFNGLKGAGTAVGQLGSFLVCQSENGCVALDMSETNFNECYKAVVSAIKKLKAAAKAAPK